MPVDGSMTRSGLLTLMLDGRRRRRCRGAGRARRRRPRGVTSRAGLSSRSATKTAWRTCPSGVHSRNDTSATSSGRTQRSAPALRRDQRPGVIASTSKASASVDLERDQARVQVARRCARSSRCRRCRRRRSAPFSQVAEQQAADLAARAVAIGEAADHELLAQRALELQPGLAALRHVGRVGALDDDAFELHAAAPPRASAPASAGNAWLRRIRSLGACVEQLAEQRAARAQRHLAQVVAVEERQVEDEILDRLARRVVDRVLQRVEVGQAVRVHHDDLAVEPRRLDAERLDRGGERLHLVGPVVAAARDQPGLALVDARHQPIAVELGLDDPVARPARVATSVASCGSSLRRQRRANRGGQVGFLGRRRRRRGGAGGARRAARVPRPGRAACATTLSGSAVMTSYSAIGRAHASFFLNSIHGVLLVARLGDPHQLPQAGELLAVEAKDELALGHAVARIADRLPRAAVPDDHGAGAVLARRDRALEAGVGERMVLDVDRHLHLRRVERRPLRHRPAEQHAVELEAKVVVQAARPVLLDDERQRPRSAASVLRCGAGAGGLRRAARSCASGDSARAAAKAASSSRGGSAPPAYRHVPRRRFSARATP